MKILDFGSANIDYVYSLENIVRPGETIQSNELNIFPGGKGTNQAIAISRAGSECYFAGAIGEDGLFLKELLEENKVNTKYLKISNQKSGHAIIQVEASGQNSIIIAHGANYENTKEYIDEVLSNFDKGDFIILQNEISNVPYIVEKAKEKGMVIFLNPSPINDDIKAIDISMVDYLLVNETEAMDISGEKDENTALTTLLKMYPNINIVLTLGEKGSIFANKNERIVTDAYKVKAVDTTAAGDTFTGYLVSLLAKGMKLFDALKYASKAAGISVSRMGAAVSVPLYSEVDT